MSANPFQEIVDLLQLIIKQNEFFLSFLKDNKKEEEKDINFTKSELANHLHCCEKTIDNYRREGLPDLQHKKGKKLLFSKKAVESFLANRK